MLGRRSQHDFEDEIRSHLQLEVDRLIKQGMSAEDAERTARRRFGNVPIAEDPLRPPPYPRRDLSRCQMSAD